MDLALTLDYGKTGLPVTVPSSQLIAPPLKIQDAEPLADPVTAIADALAQPIGSKPLAELAAGKRSACIVICDITRPVPNEMILKPMLRILEDAGIPRAGITILIATGLHRPNEGEELVELVGRDIATNYHCVNHHGKVQEEHDYLGVSTHGVPIWIDHRYTRAELKITTGLIEPHLMAGYSGGRKLICPGIAGLETVSAWHSPRFLEHPRADCGIVDGNPVHAENTEIALKTGCDFIVNVCIDGARRVTWVGAGDMIRAWEAGVEFCKAHVRAGVPEACDVVVTSCAGYPLDTTWYQAVKGLTGVLGIIKPGGTIILAASLTEGLGSPEFVESLQQYIDQGFFQAAARAMRDLKQTASPANGPLPGAGDHCEMDEWQLVMLKKVLSRCKVKVVSGAPFTDVLKQCEIEPAPTVEAALASSLAEYGPKAKYAIIPKGPYVLPYIAG
ncbi:MAG: nickel-dependent lactate racemase [Fimbriiglobus sp.]